MVSILSSLFDLSGLPPRWDSGEWSPLLGWLHVISDLAIWAAYMAIPLVIVYYIIRRKEVTNSRILWLFALFILSCGVVHLIEAVIFWWPVYRFAIVIKLATAIISWVTVLVLFRVARRALDLPALATVTRSWQREKEQRLAAEQERENFFTLSLDLLCIAGFDGYFKQINPAFTEILGWTEEELLAEPFLCFVHPDDREATVQEVEKLLQRAESMNFENRYRCRDGSYRRFLWTARMGEDEDRIYAAARDITEMHQAQQALRESEDRYRDLFENVSDLVQCVSPDGSFIYVNRAWRELMGYGEEELNSMKIMDILHPDDLEHCLGKFKSIMEGGSICQISTRFVTREGQVVHVEGSSSCRQVKGSPVATRGIFRDVTEAKRAEETLRASRDSAERANRAKSTFLANMSHEIRTPMTAILGYTEVLLEAGEIERAPGARVAALEMIQRSGKHLLEIINDILDLSRIESGKLEVEQARCSPWMILSDVVTLMRLRACSNLVSLNLTAETRLPQSIETDPTRFRQILFNLIGNAVKFTEQGEIHIRASLRKEDNSPAMLSIEISDTGPGIESNLLSDLFEPFVQGDASLTRAHGGFGLGLAISHSLAQLLGGSIQVDSQVGVGSTFKLTLPVGSLESVPLESCEWSAGIPDTQKRDRKESAQTLDGRILLAEDSGANQRLFTHQLTNAGAEVVIAKNGQEAVSIALAAEEENAPFDVILMDMQMPILDGYAATRELRAAGYQRPILALTAHAMIEEREKCLAAGCDDYATKPIERQALIRRAHALIQQYQGKAMHHSAFE